MAVHNHAHTHIHVCKHSICMAKTLSCRLINLLLKDTLAELNKPRMYSHIVVFDVFFSIATLVQGQHKLLAPCE